MLETIVMLSLDVAYKREKSDSFERLAQCIKRNEQNKNITQGDYSCSMKLVLEEYFSRKIKGSKAKRHDFSEIW